MPVWDLVDKTTILKIKLENGLDCKEQYLEYSKEIKGINKRLVDDLYQINKKMWIYEELITLAIDEEDYESIGRLYYSLRGLTHKRTEAKNKLAEKYDRFKELKKY